MRRPDHCTAEPGKECWECYQPSMVRVSERGIQRAITLVQGRATQLTHTTESIAKLEWAIYQLRELNNSQWRDMVRGPFIFERDQSKTKLLLTNDLLADIGLT